MRALHIILCAAVLIAGAACSRRVATSTATASTAVRVDTVHIIQRSADTIRQRDSVIIDRTGDTITIRQVRWRERVSIVHDTVYQRSVDTVMAESREAIATVSEPEPTFWDKVLEWLALVGCLALVGAVILWRTK